MSDFDEDVARLLDGWIRSERAFRGRHVWRVHTDHAGTRLDRVRYLMLRELVYGGQRRLTDLAERLTLTRSNASRIVESLVRSGLVDRTIPEGDRRVTIVEASPQGRELARRIDARSRRLLADRLAAFEPEEVALFSDLYDRFATEVERWSTTVAAYEPADAPDPG